MKQKILVLLAICFSVSANAKLLFEGYRKIEVKGHHVGYVIHKDEIDDATKQRTVTYFIYENIDGQVQQNAVQVVAKPEAGPTLYSGVRLTSWSWVNDDGTIATGEFDKKSLTVKTKDIKTGEIIDYKSGKQTVPPSSIFSVMGTTTFAETQPAKYTTGGEASYVAMDEETQKYGELDLKILDTKSKGDVKVSEVIADLRNDRYELYTTADGQPFGFRDAYSDREEYLVNKREEAFGEFGQSDKIKEIFKEFPRGLRNPVSDSQGKINAKEIIESFQSLKTRAELEKKKKR